MFLENVHDSIHVCRFHEMHSRTIFENEQINFGGSQVTRKICVEFNKNIVWNISLIGSVDERDGYFCVYTVRLVARRAYDLEWFFVV